MNEHVILDCTLRDGGYVNNWEFDTATCHNIMDALYESGVRVIEIGIMGNGGEAGKSTKFSDFEQMQPLLTHRKADCKYAIMTTQAEIDNFTFPQRSEQTIDMIRIAYFKAEWQEAIKSAEMLIAKGYDVYMQAMATFMYSDDELQCMLAEINRLSPAAFYIVDSFSTMYPQDVRAIANRVLSLLSDKVMFGFHAHNNFQMAFANVIEFLSIPTDRTLYVDASIFGMGRGAGNVPLELLQSYFNKHLGGHYQHTPILRVFQECIQPIYKRMKWGYALNYFLTAQKETNSVYGWYFNRKGVDDLLVLDDLLTRLPDEARYTLKRDEADRVLTQQEIKNRR